MSDLGDMVGLAVARQFIVAMLIVAAVAGGIGLLIGWFLL